MPAAHPQHRFQSPDQGPAGSLAEYEVANSGETVSSDSRQVSIAAGTTLTLTGTGSTEVTVTQSASPEHRAFRICGCLQCRGAELAKQYGQSGGPLQGQSIVYSLSQALAQMSTYYSSDRRIDRHGRSGIHLERRWDPHLQPVGHDVHRPGKLPGVIAFLGSATGGGFLQAATNAINNIETANTGFAEDNRVGPAVADHQHGQHHHAKAGRGQPTANQSDQSDGTSGRRDRQHAAAISYMTSVYQAEQTADQMYANGL
jgi:hypothetical protein